MPDATFVIHPGLPKTDQFYSCIPNLGHLSVPCGWLRSTDVDRLSSAGRCNATTEAITALAAFFVRILSEPVMLTSPPDSWKALCKSAGGAHRGVQFITSASTHMLTWTTVSRLWRGISVISPLLHRLSLGLSFLPSRLVGTRKLRLL